MFVSDQVLGGHVGHQQPEGTGIAASSPRSLSRVQTEVGTSRNMRHAFTSAVLKKGLGG